MAPPCPLKYWQRSVVFIKISVMLLFNLSDRGCTGGSAEQEDSSETEINPKDFTLLPVFIQIPMTFVRILSPSPGSFHLSSK